MIYTLTTNPAIDINISSNGVYPGKVTRTFNPVYTPNGKGLNVSFVLKHFGIKSKIFGFFGGFSGEYIVKEARKKEIEVQPVWINDITRVNFFLNDGKQEYKFVNEGAVVSKEKQKELLTLIEETDDMTFLSVSGSLSKGMAVDFYDELFKICNYKSVKVILDISSPKLKELLQYQPYLIKPNDEELQDIFDLSIKNQEDVRGAMRLLHEKGAQNILLTMGERGAYFSNGKEIYHSNVQPVKLKSSACAGDAALAAFLSIWLRENNQIELAMKQSAATGANVAESEAIGLLENVEAYMYNIQVSRL